MMFLAILVVIEHQDHFILEEASQLKSQMWIPLTTPTQEDTRLDTKLIIKI